MEEDYKAFAEMKKAIQTERPTKQVVQAKPLSRKAFLKRRKSETEDGTPSLSYQKGDFEHSCNSNITCRNKLCSGGHLSIRSHFYWNYNPNTKSISCAVEMSSSCSDSSCRNHKCGSCSSPTERFGLTTTGHNFNNRIEFTAIGTAYLKVCSYNVAIGVHASYSESGHPVEFS